MFVVENGVFVVVEDGRTRGERTVATLAVEVFVLAPLPRAAR